MFKVPRSSPQGLRHLSLSPAPLSRGLLQPSPSLSKSLLLPRSPLTSHQRASLSTLASHAAGLFPSPAAASSLPPLNRSRLFGGIVVGKRLYAADLGPKRQSVFQNRKPEASKVIVLGSGGLSIGQAGEFDYSGSQAIKALKEESVETILINPNIATIQTGKDLADKVYFLPVTPEFVEYVIQKEKPDGILLGFGGQTALNCGVKLYEAGIFEKYNVKVLGTPVRSLIVSEDRHLFNEALSEINIPFAKSVAVTTVENALSAAKEIGYPVIVRSAFALGGLGSGFANDENELQQLATRSLSLSPQILVEKSMKGWKEVEYEVVRDANDNCITVCNMENFDPLGIHTGDSIVVAPSQTLSDAEYHMLRTAAIKIVRHMKIVGECNVQYALNPNSMEYCVIEMNARLSRSSALASKATGYPLAFVAAKLGLGANLPELRNSVTKNTSAFFEPSLDYIVTKIPRWDLKKFQHVARDIGSAMKSVGEVMAIGRTFEESLQKAIRMIDPSYSGFQSLPFENIDEKLRNPTDERIFVIGNALLEKGYTVDQVHNLTKIDKWFLYKLENIAKTQSELKKKKLEEVDAELMLKSKKQGFADKQIAQLIGSSEEKVRAQRKSQGIVPVVKQIDTLAAEFPASTNYLYMTYNGTTDDVEFNDKGTMVLGSGVYRIGSSVEFDWCGVSCIRSLRKLGKKTIMLNYNPETVSTDFDECDRLYFEELSMERVMDIYEKENASGVIISVGGQFPQNIAKPLYEKGLKILGTNPHQIDNAENRFKFSKVLDEIGVDQPEWKELTTFEEAKEFSTRVGYPVLVRPSYVLSGAAMNVAYDAKDLEEYLVKAADVSKEHPVVITKYISGAREIDVDAVASGGSLVRCAISEHVEDAGVHSGDATLILPPSGVPEAVQERLKEITSKIAKAFEITGPFNTQVIWKGDDLKVIECNLRASRSFPFVSKTFGENYIEVATNAMVGKEVAPVDHMKVNRDYKVVKVPQFSYTRLAGADPRLSVEMASTGEVACFGKDEHEAYLLGFLSLNNFRLPKKNILMGFDDQSSVSDAVHTAKTLSALGYGIYADPHSKQVLQAHGVSAKEMVLDANRKKSRQVMSEAGIDLVINVARRKPTTQDDSNYLMRRLAVDFGVPLINDSKCGVLFADALAKKRPLKEGVRAWSEFVN